MSSDQKAFSHESYESTRIKKSRKEINRMRNLRGKSVIRLQPGLFGKAFFRKLALTLGLKEAFQEFRAFAGQHTRRDLHFVVQAGMIQYLEHRSGSPRFRITCAVD